MALDKAGLITALTNAFGDVGAGTTAESKANDIADAIDDYVKTALVQATIPAGAVIVSVTGGGGAPAVGIPNATPLTLNGDPNGAPDDAGGLS